MVEVVWTKPALADLDAIADYIALDKYQAAMALVECVFSHVDQLADHPNSGSYLPEFDDKRYRQLVEPQCRVIYRFDGASVYVLHVMRGEQLLRLSNLGR